MSSDEAKPGAGPVQPIVRPCELPCEKCGNSDIHRRFLPKGLGWREELGVQGYHNRYAGSDGLWWTATRDHLEHVCRVCGYRWQTLPMKKRKSA